MPKVSNERLSVGGPKETKDKKNIVEVFPAKKMAKIKGHSLCLSAPDGSQATIELLNCTVLAVSASSMPSRKWLVQIVASLFPCFQRSSFLSWRGPNNKQLFFLVVVN